MDHLIHQCSILLGMVIDNSTANKYSLALNSYLTFCNLHNIPIEPTPETLQFLHHFPEHTHQPQISRIIPIWHIKQSQALLSQCLCQLCLPACQKDSEGCITPAWHSNNTKGSFDYCPPAMHCQQPRWLKWSWWPSFLNNGQLRIHRLHAACWTYYSWCPSSAEPQQNQPPEFTEMGWWWL